MKSYNNLTEIDFNPHSRKGSDVISRVHRKRYRISIHTPARGVTDITVKHAYIRFISIHTPARGVTLTAADSFSSSFISIHTPTRGVTITNAKIADATIISIHTPARGVTLLDETGVKSGLDFNPHSRKGSDQFTFQLASNK